MLLRIKEEYPQHPVIYLTENGTALKEVKPEGENDIIDDSKRIRYIEQHLHKVLEARDRESIFKAILYGLCKINFLGRMATISDMVFSLLIMKHRRDILRKVLFG